MRCPGSIPATEGYEDAPSVYAQEGTECHEAAAAILTDTPFDKAVAGLNAVQKQIVEDYTQYIFELIDMLEDRFGKVKTIVEKRMHAPDIHPDFFGTGDFQIIVSRTPDGRISFARVGRARRQGGGLGWPD
jgi:hypothetical protein